MNNDQLTKYVKDNITIDLGRHPYEPKIVFSVKKDDRTYYITHPPEKVFKNLEWIIQSNEKGSQFITQIINDFSTQIEKK